ncbi:hypothetical protein [Croceitalea rosinachiae]|uniref:Prenyltransferase n=1 Tax=Croceitalea rosinachiae TaxID=3075596 RepID=A0ABU3ACI7_9FLAO|nr:hypothetical protein [Croceitalea sp. F388]MDT0607897.1 hypothetical protein [Croceitalea sp. F388]
MKLFKHIFNFYLDASIHVGLAVVSFYFISVKTLETSTNTALIGFLFFGTIVCYNFIKYGVEAKKYLIISNPYHRLIQAFSFLSFFGAMYFLIYLKTELWIVIVCLVLVSALYAIPFLPRAKNLRSLCGMKTYLVALVWMGCTVLLPVKDEGLPLTWDIVVLMIQRVLVVLILLMPFEIRDLRYDDFNLKTLPQRIGVKKTKSVTYFLIIIYVGLVFLKDGLSNMIVIGELAIGVLLFYAIKLTREKQPRYFASFWVELLPIMFLGIWCMLTKAV